MTFLKELDESLPEMNSRYFKIAGITVKVESSADFKKVKFNEKFFSFTSSGPGEDNVVLRHHFKLPDIKGHDLGEKIYHRVPWIIFRKNDKWIYLGIVEEDKKEEVYQVAVFNDNHTVGNIYNRESELQGVYTYGWPSLALFPTDQIWLAPVLADRKAFYVHSSAAVFNGKGLVFVGHSDAGKSTTLKLVGKNSEILCDDRNILRRWDDCWHVHGTWSHGEVPYVSSSSAPLKAVLFLQQSSSNKLEPVKNRMDIWKKLLVTIIKPMVTASWWDKEIKIIEQLIEETSFYTMHFDKSGKILKELEDLTR